MQPASHAQPLAPLRPPMQRIRVENRLFAVAHLFERKLGLRICEAVFALLQLIRSRTSSGIFGYLSR